MRRPADGQRRRKDLGLFNGEIYNFRELRRELEAKGRAFRTSGDTEVVLAAFEEWGERCFARLEGMWAIAILDLSRNRLVVSRDRFGIKPVLWSIDDGGAMLFASEIKQILAAMPRQRAAVEPRADRNVPARSTLSHDRGDVLRGDPFVPPATWCEIDLGRSGGAALPALLEPRRFHGRTQRALLPGGPRRVPRFCSRAPSRRIARPM